MKRSRSRRTPNFEIVRKCIMVSPQERHTRVDALFGTGGHRSMAGVEDVLCGIATPLTQAGALLNSQSPTPGRGTAVGDEGYVRLIRIVARSSLGEGSESDGTKEVSSKAIEDVTDRRAAERELAALLQATCPVSGNPEVSGSRLN
jgi:hypothetical protein